MIKVEGLSFQYSNREPRVLQNLSLSCNDNSVNLVLGLNGCGKTTIIKLLAGLLSYNHGLITINGKDFAKIAISERAHLVSYVPQQIDMGEDFSVMDYLLFGRVNVIKFYSSPKQADRDCVENTAERFCITHLLKKNIGELSGGERQIVSVCRAVIQNTPVILLDEPTSALDISNQHKVLSILKDIAKKDSKTIILSSHNPNHALYLNENVFLMRDGQIDNFGPAKEIITVKNLKHIYGENICNSKDLEYDEITFKD